MNKSITVLIADDEASIREGLKNVVHWDELNAHVAAVVSDGQQALTCIQQINPDISIIDISMPVMNGLEVIRQSKEQGFSTEFIILSGYNDFSYAQKAIQYGAKAYLLKPLNPDNLHEQLYKLCSMILKKKSVKVDFENMRNASRIHLLNQLIHAETYQIANLSGQLQELQLNLTDTPSRVMVCSINNTEKNSGIDEEIVSLLKQDFFDVSCEIWSPNIYQVVLLFSDQTEDEQLSLNLAKRCLYKLTTAPKCLLGIGIGDRVPDLSQISYSYNRALLTLSYQMYKDKPFIHTPDSICKQAPAISPSNVNCSIFADTILEGKEDSMEQKCAAFFNSLFYVPEPPPSFIRSMCIYLVVNVLEDLNKKCNPDFSFPEVTYDELHSLSSFSEIKDWMLTFFNNCMQIAVLMETGHSSKNDPIIENCKKYIQEHKNSNIKTKEIANFVNLSDSYCATYFKAKTGINLRDYILTTKMDYAKKLILEERMQVTEVAYELGYTDYRSFSRAFKNMTGVSPSEYTA